MSKQPDFFGPEFNLSRALAECADGIRRVAKNNAEFLDVARTIARTHIKYWGEVTADDVRRHCMIEPLHSNAWGAVFKHPDFKWTGQYRRSALVQGHGNMQRVWRRNANQN